MSSTMAVKESVDGLPKQFVSSLRILFDILDETRSGFIRLRDIESRWSDDGVRGLPPGVIDGLRRVTPPNGLLSFDRFVAGLKLVLIKKREDTDMRKPFTSKENRTPPQEYERTHPRDIKVHTLDSHYVNKPLGNRDFDHVHQKQSHRPQYPPQSNCMKHVEHHHHSDSNYEGQHLYERRSSRERPQSAYVLKPEVSSYPNSVGSHHPPPNNGGNYRQGVNSNQAAQPQERDRAPALPPRPERAPRTTYSSQMKKSLSGPNLASQSNSPPAVPPRGQHQSALVLNDLKHWQREWTENHNFDKKYSHDKKQQTLRNSNQDNEIYANIEQFQRRSNGELKKPSLLGPHKATVQRHGSGRRHTLANGIDQNMVKRMKQLEEETAMLQSGLVMVESAKTWYMKQLSLVSDKQAMMGKVTYNDNSVEAYQERMNFQRARIAEINQHLQTLLESSEKGFPIHMNLAMSTSASKPADIIILQGLREQNRRLLEEVGQKKEQISQLEMEKASLVRDLFEVRSKNKSSHDDTTFM